MGVITCKYVHMYKSVLVHEPWSLPTSHTHTLSLSLSLFVSLALESTASFQ